MWVGVFFVIAVVVIVACAFDVISNNPLPNPRL